MGLYILGVEKNQRGQNAHFKDVNVGDYILYINVYKPYFRIRTAAKKNNLFCREKAHLKIFELIIWPHSPLFNTYGSVMEWGKCGRKPG